MPSYDNVDRSATGPGPFKLIFGVLLSVLLGVLLGALHLIAKPVEVVSKPPEDAVRGQVYFVEGSNVSSKSRQWMRKRQMLAEGATMDVSLNEDELNAWMASVVAPASADAEPGFVKPERVNFRIADDVLQVGLVSKVTVFDHSRPLVFQTRGRFQRGPRAYEFTADELYVGSLPTHKVPGLKPFLIRRMLAAQELPEDLKVTWSNLKLVAVEGNSLRVSLP